MAVTITTSTNASPFAYPGNTLMDVRAAGNLPLLLVAMIKTSTANTYQLFTSNDKGATWTAYTSTVRANIVDSGSIFIGSVNWLYWCYRTNESSQDRVYVRRLRMDIGTWDAEILVSAVANGGTPGSVYGGLDLIDYSSGGVELVVIAVGVTRGSQVGVTLLGVYWISTGTPGVSLNMLPSNREWLYTGSGRIGPSIDMEHVGDGHTASASPHLWVTFGRDRLSMVKLAYIGGGWAGPIAAQDVVTGMAAHEYTVGRYDGQRFVMVCPNPVATDTVLMIERNQANTSTTTRTTPPHPTGVIRHVTMAYSPFSNFDTRIYAVGTSTAVIYFIDFVRQTGLFTSWAIADAAAVIGSTAQEWGVTRNSFWLARHNVYGGRAANILSSTSQTVTYAPFTPTWVNQTGQAADVAATLLLDWNFSDADPGDTQSAFALSRQIGAATIAYFRASDSTWQPAEVQNASATSSRTLAAAWGAGTDQPHTYRVKVWDAASTPSAYSDALVVIASTVVNPAIVTPTPAQVLTGDSVTLTWTAAEETAFRVTLSITAGAQLFDSGWIAGSALTYTVPYTLLNGGAYTVTLETRNNEGLPSVAQTRNVTVSYLAPDTPTVVNTAVPASGWIATVITNPTPTGGRPVVASNDVYRRPVGDTSDGVRMAIGVANAGTYNDWQAVGGVPYEYRVLARGTNGTSVFSAWTT